MITGHCNRCGDCCKPPATSAMLDVSGYCRHLRFEDSVSICRFHEGVTEPAEDYKYYLRACVPFPRNVGDLRSVPRCSYGWVTNG